MYDPLILIITAIILVETSFLLVRRKTSFGGGGSRAILVDTSVLIDGRILDIAEAGFVPGRLVIPRSVLGELQLLADGSDHEKRARARNGLEVITKLQAVPGVVVEIYGDQSDAREGVDNRLLSLSRKLGYELCTVDYNLQKVAQAESIKILSINELSQKLRALYLPGEKLDLTLKQKGQEKGQAIGYASDGTMVVVDHADKFMDKTVEVEVIRSLQTNSGKMMFARLALQVEPERNAPADKGNRRVFSRNRRQPQPQSSQQSQAQPAVKQQSSRSTPSQSATAPQPFGRSRNSSPEDDLLNLVNKQ